MEQNILLKIEENYSDTDLIENYCNLICLLTVFCTTISRGYSHLSNKRGAHAYQFWEIPPSSKKNPPSSFIDFITKVSDINAEPDDNFSDNYFEL